MFDTMTLTKAAGALIGSLLFLLLMSWAASGVYHVGASGGHGEGEEHAQAYTIPVEDAGGSDAETADAGPDFATVMASADAAAGEKVFGKCKACHKLDGTDGTGPHLNGVVGRAVASIGGFGYSDPMVAHAAEAPNWTPEALQEFLTSPKTVVPGTKMSFAGIRDEKTRINLIAWLRAQGSGGFAIPAPDPARQPGAAAPAADAAAAPAEGATAPAAEGAAPAEAAPAPAPAPAAAPAA